MKYYINDNMAPIDEATLLQQLNFVSEQRREKVLRFRHHSGRQQSLMAYQLLQRALKEEYGITEPPVFRELDNGKPVIIGHEDIHFNLSHCKYGIACAVSSSAIGIDIEKIPEKLDDSLMRYIFNEKEIDMVSNACGYNENGEEITPQIMFSRLWTMKEATVKLTGRGLTGKEQLRPLLNSWHEGTSKYQYITIQNPSHHWVMSICMS